MRETPNWPDPRAHILRHRPDTAMVYFCPAILQATARRFQQGFDGLVTYAVKANAGEEVLTNLVAAGIRAFDVASPREMYAVRATCPDAVLHYHNPVRSPEEMAVAVALGVASYSVDCENELDKLSAVPAGTEMSPCGWPCRWRGRPMISAKNSGWDRNRRLTCCGRSWRARLHAFDDLSPRDPMCRPGGLGQLYQGGGRRWPALRV